MNEQYQKLILDKAVDLASDTITSAMEHEEFESLEDKERAIAVVTAVTMSSLIALNTLAELFGEEFVEDVLSYLELDDDEDADVSTNINTDIDTDMRKER